MKKLDYDVLKRLVLETLNESAGSADIKEIWYVKKTNGGVKNISTSRKGAEDFLWNSLKGDGEVYYVEVPLADWNSEKVNVSNIEQYARKLYR